MKKPLEGVALTKQPPAQDSALVIPLLEAESVVARWRRSLDPAAALGVPAHVTVLFPWVPAADVDDGVLRDLDELVHGVPQFDVALSEVCWFGREVLWLAPEPVAPIVELTTRTTTCWPAFPPYGGQFDVVVPHVTVGVGESTALETAAAELSAVLPIRDTAAQVWWLTRLGSQPWVLRRRVDLG